MLSALRSLVVRPSLAARLFSSEVANADIFNPTEEHGLLRETVRTFAEEKVLPQAVEYNRDGECQLLLYECVWSLRVVRPLKIGECWEKIGSRR